MLDQPFMTDIIEASSISHMPQLIDIYSASWGPTDNGKTVDGPRELTLQAMADGVNKVRSIPASALGAQYGGGCHRWRTVMWSKVQGKGRGGAVICASCAGKVLREKDPKTRLAEQMKRWGRLEG